jgi:signal transduction histidine kinase
VLSNLVGNALQHGDERCAIDVTVSGTGSDVLLTVVNQGPEIPAGAMPTLFDPFIRAASRGSDKRAQGVGLGLYISREIVTAHAGTISVESSQDAGTVFSVRLPRKPPAMRATDQQA